MPAVTPYSGDYSAVSNPNIGATAFTSDLSHRHSSPKAQTFHFSQKMHRSFLRARMESEKPGSSTTISAFERILHKKILNAVFVRNGKPLNRGELREILVSALIGQNDPWKQNPQEDFLDRTLDNIERNDPGIISSQQHPSLQAQSAATARDQRHRDATLQACGSTPNPNFPNGQLTTLNITLSCSSPNLLSVTSSNGRITVGSATLIGTNQWNIPITGDFRTPYTGAPITLSVSYFDPLLGPQVQTIPISIGGPSIAPTQAPSPAPTFVPTYAPSGAPTLLPPNAAPSPAPIVPPSEQPSQRPSAAPSNVPSLQPTLSPTGELKTVTPTSFPTNTPTPAPSYEFTQLPSSAPTAQPTPGPTFGTLTPTSQPTNGVTAEPILCSYNSTTGELILYNATTLANGTTICEQPFTLAPSQDPTKQPTLEPTPAPAPIPTRAPTNAPSATPTFAPSTTPTALTLAPNSAAPTTVALTPAPSVLPTAQPSASPTPESDYQFFTTSPTASPTATSTETPILCGYNATNGTWITVTPITLPNGTQSCNVTLYAPSPAPSNAPSNAPTLQPIAQTTLPPSLAPIFAPTQRPTTRPTQANSTAEPPVIAEASNASSTPFIATAAGITMLGIAATLLATWGKQTHTHWKKSQEPNRVVKGIESLLYGLANTALLPYYACRWAKEKITGRSKAKVEAIELNQQEGEPEQGAPVPANLHPSSSNAALTMEAKDDTLLDAGESSSRPPSVLRKQRPNAGVEDAAKADAPLNPQDASSSRPPSAIENKSRTPSPRPKEEAPQTPTRPQENKYVDSPNQNEQEFGSPDKTLRAQTKKQRQQKRVNAPSQRSTPESIPGSINEDNQHEDNQSNVGSSASAELRQVVAASESTNTLLSAGGVSLRSFISDTAEAAANRAAAATAHAVTRALQNTLEETRRTANEASKHVRAFNKRLKAAEAKAAAQATEKTTRGTQIIPSLEEGPDEAAQPMAFTRTHKGKLPKIKPVDLHRRTSSEPASPRSQ